MKPKAASGSGITPGKELTYHLSRERAPDYVKIYLASIGRQGGLIGGQSTSPAKREAARQNGKLGGRPKGRRNKVTRKQVQRTKE